MPTSHFNNKKPLTLGKKEQEPLPLEKKAARAAWEKGKKNSKTIQISQISP